MARYAFRRRSWRWLAAAADAVGGRVRRGAPAPDPASLRRVVLLRLDHLGDVLFVTPALRAARAALPEAHLTLVVGPWAEAIVRDHPALDAVHVFRAPWFERPRRRGGWRAWRQLVAWLRSGRFDAGIDFRGDARHILALRAARVPVRIGYGRTGLGFLLTHAPAWRRAHEVERDVDLVRVLDAGAGAGPLDAPACDAAAAAQAERLLALTEPGTKVVVFHLTAGYASKIWEPESLAALLDLTAADPGVRCVVIGSDAERSAIDAVVVRTRRPPLVLAGRTDLRQLVALLARADAFVGHDSGPAHLAVAAGVPSVLLYSGVNDPAEWGPWGGRVHLFHHAVECSPCGLAVCDRGHECMRAFVPEAVHAALARALAGGRA